MELFKIGFITIRVVDMLDIAITTFLLYKLFDALKGTLAFRIMTVVFSLFIMWKLVEVLEFRLLKSILDQLLGIGAVALVIIFAPEVRRFLTDISKNTILERFLRQVGSRIRSSHSMVETESMYIEVVESLKALRASNNGALIVFPGKNALDEIVETGELINAEVSSSLISALFQKESPLHDGAMILDEDKIVAARCILPLSNKKTLPPELGLRHRAAIGMTEITDALVLILSEERKEISLAAHGDIRRTLDYTEVEQAIVSHLQGVRS